MHFFGADRVNFTAWHPLFFWRCFLCGANNKSLNDEDLNINLKNPLNKFKNTLLINSNIDEINGVNIIKPNKIFLKKYRIFSNVMFITPLKKSKSEHDLQINSNSYRNLYNSINNNKLTKLIGRENNEIKNRNRIFSNRHTRKMYSVMNLKNEYNNIFEPVYHEFTKKESTLLILNIAGI